MMLRIDNGGNVKVALLLAFLAATPAVLRADVKLPRIFTGLSPKGVTPQSL